MVIFQIATLLLIVLLLLSMMAKARPWKKEQLPGKPLQTISMGLLPKLVTYRSSLLALLTGCVLSTLTGWLPSNMTAMVAVFALIILLMPMRYTLTTKGIAVGDAVFHPWKDFSGFSAKRSSLKLTPSSNFGSLTLFVKPTEMSSVLKYVERNLKHS
ncbi:MAG: hypothetical protein ABI986_05735 [Chloroflexota bacterium]